LAIERFEQLEVWQGDPCAGTRRLQGHPLLAVRREIWTGLSDEASGGVNTGQHRRGFQTARPAGQSHFYNIAQASLEETRYYFILCRDLGYKIEFDVMTKQADQISRMLGGLIKSVKGGGGSQ
jgi:hypothetical protein